ncbi:MAG TPA: hypothetical protein VGO64_00930, partial [Candidatus Limnocylindrales bacterium]|nr:hypothetical protein [Candidatus Limnocylindrales bacterium]
MALSTVGSTTRHSRSDRRSRSRRSGGTAAQVEPSIGSIQILDARVMRGPNRWSRSPMIRLLVDLGSLEERPTNTIDGFAARLVEGLPGLEEHHCSLGRRGGFLERLRDGTWLGHVAEHVALELQGLAGNRVTRGKTRRAGVDGRYDIVFAYRVESVGLAAGRSAVELVNALVNGDQSVAGDALATTVERIVDELRRLSDRDGLGPSTQAIVDEARRRGIPWMRLDDRNLVQLGWGSHSRRIRATITDGTGTIATDLARDKDDAAAQFERAGLPVPRWDEASSAEDAVRIARKIGHPVVVKPIDGNHGRAVGLDLMDDVAVARAFEAAAAGSQRRTALVQAQLPGRDHRLLVVGGRLVACAERVSAYVVGDGESTIRALVDEANRDPRRGDGHARQLTRIRL